MCECIMNVYPLKQTHKTHKHTQKQKQTNTQIEEPWVACDLCGVWIHQPCALFNKGQNNDHTQYHCPWCLLSGMLYSVVLVVECCDVLYSVVLVPQTMRHNTRHTTNTLPTHPQHIPSTSPTHAQHITHTSPTHHTHTGLEHGTRARITNRPQAMLEARDLPKCNLSDHLEARLQQSLARERMLRAQQMGVPPQAVPTVEGLTIRVINSVQKVLDVKQRFYETFSPGGYQERFKYRQKVCVGGWVVLCGWRGVCVRASFVLFVGVQCACVCSMYCCVLCTWTGGDVLMLFFSMLYMIIIYVCTSSSSSSSSSSSMCVHHHHHHHLCVYIIIIIIIIIYVFTSSSMCTFPMQSCYALHPPRHPQYPPPFLTHRSSSCSNALMVWMWPSTVCTYRNSTTPTQPPIIGSSTSPTLTL